MQETLAYANLNGRSRNQSQSKDENIISKHMKVPPEAGCDGTQLP